MRHQKSGFKLNRNPSHRLALFRNLTRSLLEHERIITTTAKAKAVKPFVEKLITLAKKGTLHARRLAIARLGPMAKIPLLDKKEEYTGDTVVNKLFSDLAGRFAERPGGYTRILKRSERRLGDGGTTVFLELLKDGEKKAMNKPRQTPAPVPTPIPHA